MSATLALGQHGRHHAFGASARDSSAGHRMVARSVLVPPGVQGEPNGSRPPSDNAQVRPPIGLGAMHTFGRDDFTADGNAAANRGHLSAADAALRALHAEVPPYLQGSVPNSRMLQDDEKQCAGTQPSSFRNQTGGLSGMGTAYGSSYGSSMGSSTMGTSIGSTARHGRRHSMEGGSQQHAAPGVHPLLYASTVSSGRDNLASSQRRSSAGEASRRAGGTGASSGSPERRRASEEASWPAPGQRQAPFVGNPSSLASLLQLPATPRQPAMSKPLPALSSPARRAAAEEGRVALLASVAEEANACYRAHMEDSAVIIDPFIVEEDMTDVEQWGFFAVYDGHGGRQAVDYTEQKLHEILLGELRAVRPARGVSGGIGRWSDEVVADALTKTFMKVDDQLRLVGAWRQGCTATVTLVRKTQNAMRLHVANVGDSRAVAVDLNYDSWRVSVDHRPTEITEVKRVEQEGGFVSRGRVAGQLGVSRALGDHALKGQGVSWRPSISARDATQDVALIIASDGLWDAMCDSDARMSLERSLEDQKPEQAALRLVNEAQHRGSTDNITVLLAFFAAELQA